MTKDQLIAKQQLEIEHYKSHVVENKEIKRQLVCKFYAMGQPLNDNILHFNNEQMAWCVGVVSLIEQINTEIAP